LTCNSPPGHHLGHALGEIALLLGAAINPRRCPAYAGRCTYHRVDIRVLVLEVIACQISVAAVAGSTQLAFLSERWPAHWMNTTL
jgi:hypothetical protein